MEVSRPKTWKPTVAGILDIVSGASGLIGGLVVLLGVMFFFPVASWGGPGPVPDMPNWAVPGILSAIAVIGLIFVIAVGVLSLIGGVFALQRRRWGWALTGSIAAIFASSVLGILATVFVAIGKDEFET
jgi:hypothetical protein